MRVGIDEAGRGPLLGPMVVAAVAAPASVFEELREAGVRDSKELSRHRREELYRLIVSKASYVGAVYVPPETIDSVNLNTLERDTFAYLLSRILGILGGVEHVFVDAVGSPRKIVEALRRTGYRGTVTAEPGADRRYVEVSAASIVAKVLRDRAIDELREKYGVRGSGYPTDPETLSWLREAYARSPRQPPPFIRRSWGTLRRLAPGWYRPKTIHGGGQVTLDYFFSKRRLESTE